jgi:hypothetical protein
MKHEESNGVPRFRASIVSGDEDKIARAEGAEEGSQGQARSNCPGRRSIKRASPERAEELIFGGTPCLTPKLVAHFQCADPFSSWFQGATRNALAPGYLLLALRGLVERCTFP